jgi:3-oxoacyl-[acyl-carrier protein] reductase
MSALQGKVAIVTGSSRGIGRAIALRLAQDGAAVVINYTHRKEKADDVVVEIQSKAGKAAAIQADVSNTSDIHHLFQTTIEQFKALDIVVNSAGTFIQKNVAEVTPEEFDRALLHKGGVADGRDMVSFNYHTKTCHESSIPHPQLV